jgi:signal transduction histidine kinase/CheY-like chemotaxis protein
VLIFIIFLAFLASINFRRRRANEALSKANHELQKAFSYAEQANRAKTDFLSRISHEIRTPIHIITGMTDLSFDKVSDQDFIFDALKKISSASDYLLALVNDVLDMSRIERGKTVINNDSFFISSVMDTIASLFEGKTKDKGIQLLIRTNKIENDYVYGDREHIEQVLINLLDNALKYTEKGKIEVTVFEEKRASIFSLFTFVVKDTGLGIEADRLRSIWEPFEKAKTKIKTKGSFGLGLSIVKSLVHLMGGTVQVESTPNEGSAFLFSVPLKILQATKEKRRKSDSIGEIEEMYNKEKILVVEDNDLNADIVRMMLERKNLTVDIVHDGKEAVDRLLETEATYYSLVLMDIRMPVMDGREATKLIRNSGREDLKTIPIVAMSADAFAEEIKLAQSVGMNEYLTKPVRSESLYAMVYLFLRGDKKASL